MRDMIHLTLKPAEVYAAEGTVAKSYDGHRMTWSARAGFTGACDGHNGPKFCKPTTQQVSEFKRDLELEAAAGDTALREFLAKHQEMKTDERRINLWNTLAAKRDELPPPPKFSARQHGPKGGPALKKNRVR